MRRFWKHILLTAGMAATPPLAAAVAQQYAGYAPGPGYAMNPGYVAAPAPASSNDDLRARLDAQEAELQELRQRIQAADVSHNASFTSLNLDSNSSAAAAEAGPTGYEVGSDLKMNARWNPANGVTFETANKDFISHMGVRFQVDFVGFNESPGLTTRPFGTLEDGVFFRRVRPSWDGTAYEVMEWNVELALEQTQNNVPNLDNVWVGIKDLPFVNTFRIGHMHLNQGLEGDMSASSKAMTFMERAAYTDAFYENLGTGMFLGNHIADDHVTWSATAYKQDNSTDGDSNNTGADFNNGKWGYTGRLTVLPFYQDDGRHMLHLGVSATYRDAQIQTLGGPSVTQYRARPQMRDQIGAEPLGNSNRLVDTGAVTDKTNTVIGSELFYVLGPASLQAEYAWASMNDATGAKVNTQNQNLWFGGGYVQGSYFLTGENRIYDRRFGVLGTDYIATPYTPFWLVKDASGDCCWGSGAWEVACRYSHLSLNNQYLVAQGGETDALEIGVNWYLNTNLKFQFEYLRQTCFGGGPNGDGIVNGFGFETQFFF